MDSRNAGTGNWDIYFGSSRQEPCAINVQVNGFNPDGILQAAIALVSSATMSYNANVTF